MSRRPAGSTGGSSTRISTPPSRTRCCVRRLLSTNLAGSLDELLPTHPQYAALKAALETTPATDNAKLNRIRLNMDRWRWLPRDLGHKYIIVNVPGFHATLVEDGVNRWKQRAIAGKLSTPTPQLNATAVGVMLNPVVGSAQEHRAGSRGQEGLRPDQGPGRKDPHWRQPPGPTNALGQVKFVMPNSKSDLPARHQCPQPVQQPHRALSHGCVRTSTSWTSRPNSSATTAANGRRTRSRRRSTARRSVQANFVKPLPVYIVYFSSAALNDGQIVDYKDLYGRDAKAMAAMQMKDGGASLAPPKVKPRIAMPRLRSRSPSPRTRSHALTSSRLFGAVEDDRVGEGEADEAVFRPFHHSGNENAAFEADVDLAPGVRSVTLSPITPPSEML